MFKTLALAAMLAVFAGTFAFSGGVAQAAATLFVAPLFPTTVGLGSCTTPNYNTIQAAITAASPGDTIQVCPGVYMENVDVNKPLLVKGAQAGVPAPGRAAPESVVKGVNLTAGIAAVTISAPSVTLDGFTVTNTVTAGAAFGVTVKAGADNAIIANNIVDTIKTPDTTGNGTAQAIYLENGGASDGADDVTITANRLSNISSDRSAKGVLIGVNGATGASTNVKILGNAITDVTSTTRGAYGVSVANVTGPQVVSGLVVQNNTIDKLTSGGWVHAIGLEGNTPGVKVLGNTISNLTNSSPDNIAVFFEVNPGFSGAMVNNNNFNLTTASFGIAVHPGILGTGQVNGTCNWWGSPSGPGPVGPGTGAQVSPRVTYLPWQIAPSGACVGNPVTDKDDCKNGGWMTRTRADGTVFKNQGDCVSYTQNGR